MGPSPRVTGTSFSNVDEGTYKLGVSFEEHSKPKRKAAWHFTQDSNLDRGKNKL